jgi:hypothetical protein
MYSLHIYKGCQLVSYSYTTLTTRESQLFLSSFTESLHSLFERRSMVSFMKEASGCHHADYKEHERLNFYFSKIRMVPHDDEKNGQFH